MSLDFLRRRKTLLSGVGLAAVAVVAFNIPASAVSPPGLHSANTGAYVGSVSGSYVLGAENTASGNPFNDYSIEGFLANDVGGVGVLGYGEPAKSYGVYGVTFGSNGIGVYGAGDGPTPAPNATPSLQTESTGVVGNSSSGDGVYGSTLFPNTSGDEFGESPVGGVMGVDLTTNGHENNGVVGMTTNGGYGVVGFSSDADVGSTDVAAYGGVEGTATGGDGVDGFSTTGFGVEGGSNSSAAVYGESTSGSGGDFVSGTGEGLTVQNDSSGYAADVLNTDASAGDGLVSQADFIGITGRAASFPLVLTNNSGTDEFYVDSSGNVYYGGSLNSFARTRNGFTASTFTARQASPTVEDVGTGSIVNGSGSVRLDPALVEQMDRSTAYHVFLTPDGDTNGLFVATKTAEGFVVRETRGGRSSLSFDYRIVASVDGQANRRMSLSRSAQLPVAPMVARSMSSTRGVVSAKRAALMRMQAAHIASHPIFVPQRNMAAEALHHI
jgi:hypothetical protein